MRYKPFAKFIVRTPQYSMAEWDTVLNPQNHHKEIENLLEFFKKPLAAEALFLASPELYYTFTQYQAHPKNDNPRKMAMVYSLSKYFVRMTGRSTPFGLFASCSIGDVADKTKIVVENSLKDARTSRLDMHYLCALAETMARSVDIRKQLTFYPNPSLYRIGTSIRYTEYFYNDTLRLHRISSIDNSEYLESILAQARGGAAFNNLLDCLTNEGVEYEAADSFLHEIIDSQLLLHSLEPCLTGDEFLSQIVATLNKMLPETNVDLHNKIWPVSQLIAHLKQIQESLATFDRSEVNPIDAYQQLISSIRSLGISFEEKKVIQTDLVKKLRHANLDQRVLRDVMKVIRFVNRITPFKTESNLQRFKQAFFERFETREVPLLYALDVETGIGYIQTSVPDDGYLKLNAINRILLRKVLQAREAKAKCITLTDEDFGELSEDWTDGKDTLPCMFEMVNDNGSFVPMLTGAGGSSAANILGRFCHTSSDINSFVREVVGTEESMLPDGYVYAEIVHLPETRLGNVMARPVLRKYEIPYVGRSGAPIELQITPDDLLISIRANTVYLRSNRLNKYVIPRLANAHNYYVNALPVYQFLSEMQLQNSRAGMGFMWGGLESPLQKMPRVYYKNVIISPAKWLLDKAEFECILADGTVEIIMANVKAWQKRWDLPRRIQLRDYDNELMIDLDSPLCVRMFIHAIKSRDAIYLSEYLHDPSAPFVQDNAGRPYANQFYAAYYREQDNTEGISSPMPRAAGLEPSPQRTFIVGEKWLYFKLYCGTSSADRLLVHELYPLVKKLEEDNLIDKWFFIRYNDPHNHLRLRVLVHDEAMIQTVLTEVKNACLYYLEHGILSKLQLDTYHRELERYGPEAIEDAESLFHIDSVIVAVFLSAISEESDEKREHLKWIQCLRGMDQYLRYFGLDLLMQKEFTEGQAENFALEFTLGRHQRNGFGDRFRKERSLVESVLKGARDTVLAPYLSMLNSFEEKQRAVVNAMATRQQTEGAVTAHSRMSSYIHMFVNRLFPQNQRYMEMMAYHILAYHYRSEIARQKPITKIKANLSLG